MAYSANRNTFPDNKTLKSIYSSLQFFQRLVMQQCYGQSYGSSVSQTIVSEAAVEYADMNTLELDSQYTNSMFLSPWQ